MFSHGLPRYGGVYFLALDSCTSHTAYCLFPSAAADSLQRSGQQSCQPGSGKLGSNRGNSKDCSEADEGLHFVQLKPSTGFIESFHLDKLCQAPSDLAKTHKPGLHFVPTILARHIGPGRGPHQGCLADGARPALRPSCLALSLHITKWPITLANHPENSRKRW